MTASTRYVQAQDVPYPNMEREGVYKVHPQPTGRVKSVSCGKSNVFQWKAMVPRIYGLDGCAKYMIKICCTKSSNN